MPHEKSENFSSQADLMQALGSTQDDLDSNRRGFVSERQKARLKRRYLYPLALPVGCALVLIGIGMLVGVLVALSLDMFVIFSAAMIWGFAIVLLMHAWYRYARLQHDLNEHAIETVQGVAVVSTGRNTTPYIEIDGQRFHPGARVCLRVQHLTAYRIYYLDKSRHMLSMESFSQEDYVREQRLAKEQNLYRQSQLDIRKQKRKRLG